MGIDTLYIDLVSAWQLSESTGDRKDSKGSNDLTVVNNVGRRLCQLGYGCDFALSLPTYLILEDANQTGLEPGSGNLSVSLWFIDDAVTQVEERVLVCKAKQSAISWIVQLGFDGSNGLQFVTSSNGIDCDTLVYEPSPSPTPQPHLVVATWNNSTYTKRLYLDGVLVGESVLPTPEDIDDNDSPFCVGSLGGESNFFDGAIGNLNYWNKELTEEEALLLWNNGYGFALYPEVIDSLDLDIDFNNRRDIIAYRQLILNTMSALKYEPSMYELDGLVLVDNRGRWQMLKDILRFIDNKLLESTGRSKLQGPDREIY